jgi:hypothetical protein
VQASADLTRAARAQDLAAAEPLERALRCWRGTPFADAAPCALLDDEAQRLSEVRVSLVDDYYVARLEEGASSEIVADLGRLVVEHPLRESLWASLITAQYRAGRQADALRSFEQLRTVLADTAGLSPSTRLQDLQAQVLAHDPTLASGRGERADARPSGAAATRGRGNLPVLATVRVDTDDRLGAAVDLVRHHRFVTLTGTGGAGKTRMAVEVGWSTIDDFDDGVWMIELAPIAHDDAVPAAVLSMLGVRASQAQTEADTPADLLVDWLRGRDLLLVLDNCEHVLNAVGSLGEVILSRCPSVKVVATSREPLGVAGERVHAVPMLDPEVDAVALFIDRAMAADSAFVARGRTTVRSSRTSADVSTDSRWRSSSPRHGSGRSRRPRSSRGSTTASRSSVEDHDRDSAATRRFWRRCSGRTSCSMTRSGQSSLGCPSSPVDSMRRPQTPSAATSTLPSARLSRSSPASSRSPSSSRDATETERGTAFLSHSANSPTSS